MYAVIPSAAYIIGTFQYFLLYTCPHPGIIADRMAAFLGLCVAFMIESTFAAGMESFLFKLSTFCPNPEKQNERDINNRTAPKEKRLNFVCILILHPFKNVGLIRRNVHLPENMVEFIQRVIFNIDLSASIPAVLKFYPSTKMRR